MRYLAPISRQMRRLGLVVVLCVALSASVVAAGAHAQTRRGWARSANAVCAKGLAKVRAVVEDMQAHPPKTVRQWAVGYDKTIAAFAGMRRGIAAIPRPAKDRRRIADMVSALGRGIREMRSVRRARLGRDLRALRRHLARARRFMGRADSIAAALGADVCANG
jgi:hypothetical protein